MQIPELQANLLGQAEGKCENQERVQEKRERRWLQIEHKGLTVYPCDIHHVANVGPSWSEQLWIHFSQTGKLHIDQSIESEVFPDWQRQIKRTQ